MAISVSRRAGSAIEFSTGSAALASRSSAKLIRVTTRSSSPRANTDTSRCGASVPPPGHGSGPGRSVTTRNRPPASVGHRPNPRNRAAGEPPPPVLPGTVPATPRGSSPASPRGSSGWEKRPSGPACQVSTSASGTGSPAPSSTRPAITIAPGAPSSTTNGPSGHGSPIAKNGPTVCDGVTPSGRTAGSLSRPSCLAAAPLAGVLEHGLLPAAQHDVPLVAEGPLRLGQVEVEPGDHPLPGRRVRHRVEDRVLGEERVAGKVHLRHQPLRERPAEQREVDVRRAPGVQVVAPRVGAGLDGDEAVPALAVGDAPAGA